MTNLIERYRYWLLAWNPDFVTRACVILDLYAGLLKANGLEMSRPASARILLDRPTPQLAGSAPSSC